MELFCAVIKRDSVSLLRFPLLSHVLVFSCVSSPVWHWMSPLALSFLDKYRLSMSSLGCKVLCRVIIFVVLLSIYLSSSLVHSKKDSRYLTRITAQVFISLMKFLQLGFKKFSFSSDILVSYFFFLLWWCQLPIFLSTNKFLFLQVFWCLPDLPVLLFLWFLFFYYSARKMFQLRIPFLYPGCIFLLFVWEFLVLFHFWQISGYHPYT